MRRGIGAIAIAMVALAAPLHAQGPRVTTFIGSSVFRPAWPSPARDATVSLRLLSSRDSAAIRPTYWLEGGLIGGVLVGLIGSQLCNIGDGQPPTSCYVMVFALTGGGVGFPAGALIGGQFPKH